MLPWASANELTIAIVPDATLVVNATGLGEDRPGSPLTDHAPGGPARWRGI